jgi:nitrile hydratase subunit beta
VSDEGRRHHDLGGLPAGKVVRDEHEREAWEKRCDALAVLLWDKDRKLVKVDERRRHIEDLGAEIYRNMGYYERWMHAVAQGLLERGVITVDELGRMMEQQGDGRG